MPPFGFVGDFFDSIHLFEFLRLYDFSLPGGWSLKPLGILKVMGFSRTFAIACDDGPYLDGLLLWIETPSLTCLGWWTFDGPAWATIGSGSGKTWGSVCAWIWACASPSFFLTGLGRCNVDQGLSRTFVDPGLALITFLAGCLCCEGMALKKEELRVIVWPFLVAVTILPLISIIS